MKKKQRDQSEEGDNLSDDLTHMYSIKKPGQGIAWARRTNP